MPIKKVKSFGPRDDGRSYEWAWDTPTYESAIKGKYLCNIICPKILEPVLNFEIPTLYGEHT